MGSRGILSTGWVVSRPNNLVEEFPNVETLALSQEAQVHLRTHTPHTLSHQAANTRSYTFQPCVFTATLSLIYELHRCPDPSEEAEAHRRVIRQVRFSLSHDQRSQKKLTDMSECCCRCTTVPSLTLTPALISPTRSSIATGAPLNLSTLVVGGVDAGITSKDGKARPPHSNLHSVVPLVALPNDSRVRVRVRVRVRSTVQYVHAQPETKVLAAP
jgi:hypothetical protein